MQNCSLNNTIGCPTSGGALHHLRRPLGLRAAPNGTPWQRCQYHLPQNTQAYITRQHLKSNVATDIKTNFNADNCVHAEERLRRFIETYCESQTKLAIWTEEKPPRRLGRLSIAEAHRKKMRASKICEIVNSQIKRRTRVVGIFPNEDSLLRLVIAVSCEMSEAWEAGKAYLKLN